MYQNAKKISSRKKKEIEKYIIEILKKIECYYGENSAPFGFPLQYEITEKNEFLCKLINEDDSDMSYIYTAKIPENLLRKIKADIPSRFSLSFD